MVSQAMTRYCAVRCPELPSHAYHPNASLRLMKRSGYIAWPKSLATADRADLN